MENAPVTTFIAAGAVYLAAEFLAMIMVAAVLGAALFVVVAVVPGRQLLHVGG